MQSRLRKKTGRQKIRFERHGVGAWGNAKVGDKVKKRQKWEWQLYLTLAERLCRYVSPRTLLQSDCAHSHYGSALQSLVHTQQSSVHLLQVQLCESSRGTTGLQQ